MTSSDSGCWRASHRADEAALPWMIRIRRAPLGGSAKKSRQSAPSSQIPSSRASCLLMAKYRSRTGAREVEAEVHDGVLAVLGLAALGVVTFTVATVAKQPELAGKILDAASRRRLPAGH